MSGFDRIAEEKIRQALEAGEFRNLRGAGKPLRLDDNPYEPEGWGVAFTLLKNNGYTLPWIEESKEIDHELAAAHRGLADAGPIDPDARAAFASRVEALNRRILGYNLRVPSPAFQRRLLHLPTELAAVEAGQLFHLDE
jgi:hypothetical protein